MATRISPAQNTRVVSHEQWVNERVAFMAKEKEFTRLRDELSRQRRELPWEKVTKSYVFDGPRGKETLAELFENRSQLVVYHLMFAPTWDEACKSCSFWADNFNGIDIHLAHRDITFLAISRAPLAKLEAYKKRMGWSFKWVSAGETDFNYDFQVSFDPEKARSGAVTYNYGTGRRGRRGDARRQRVLQGPGRRHLPHLLDLLARDRSAERRVQLHRSHSQRA